MAVTTTLREPYANVQHEGALGDGSTNDRAAFVSAATKAYTVLIPYTANGYRFGSGWTVPANTRLLGIGARRSRILHGFNGDFLTMADGAVLEHLWVDGQGATYSGKGLLFTGSDGHQKLLSCKVADFSDFCLDFAVDAGSQFSAVDLETWQTDGGTSGKFAVNISNTEKTSAAPRKFVAVETNGKKFINFGGCNNVYVSASFVGECAYTANTRAALMTGSRVGVNELLMDVDGHNNTIVGCDISPAITVLSGADNIAVQGNSYNHAPYITDNSGNNRNLLDTFAQSYTPTLTSSNGDATLGDGTITGAWSRSGAVVTAVIDLTLGSTTSFGTGGIRLSLPKASTVTVQVGAAYALDASTGIPYVLAAIVASGQSYATFRANGGGPVAATVPFTWTTSDTLRATISYVV